MTLPANGPRVDITMTLSSSILGMPNPHLYCIDASRSICSTIYANVSGVPQLDAGQVTIPRDSWRLHVALEKVTHAGPQRHMGARGYPASGYYDDTYKPGLDPKLLGLDPVTLSRPIFEAVPLAEARELTTRLLDEGRITLPDYCPHLKRGEDSPMNALARLAWTVFMGDLTAKRT